MKKELPRFDLNATPLTRGTTLIEASAGTGKTYTIAGLFVRLILEEDLAVSEILVTTYTKPATAELRERIRTRLSEARAALQSGAASDPFLAEIVRLHRADPRALPRLESALRQFDEAPIYTIHGFCQRMLQDRAFESGVPFSAELIEDQRPLLQEVAEDFWRRQFYESNEFFTILALHEKVTPALLARALQDAANKPRLQIIPARGTLARVQEEVLGFFDKLRAHWESGAEKISAPFLKNNGWASGATTQGRPEKMRAALAALAACVSPLGAPLSAFDRLGDLAQSKIDRAARRNATPPQHPLFALCDGFEALSKRFAAALKAEFLHTAPGDLAARKQRLNVLSFDDLLTRLENALNGSGGLGLAALIRSRFRAALIDEFQDTDAIQEASFRQIFENPDGWLYLIGDPKQAIYGFRGADVFSYLAAADRAQHAFTLQTNFRSESRLVEAVNTLFSRHPNPFGTERIPFRKVAADSPADAVPLQIGGQRIPPLRFWWWDENDAAIASALALEQLPLRTAAAIAQLLGGPATFAERRAQPSDFAVLVATHEQAHAVQRALSRLRIPAVLYSSANVFESREAEELQTVLAAVVEPSRDARIRAALATSLWANDAASLDALARDEPQWQRVLLRFHRYHEIWSCEGFVKMFRVLLQTEHIREHLLAGDEGARRLTNLLHLSELLHQAACARRLGMAALVKWLAEQRAPGTLVDEERELRLERDEDAVQVVTMHKSKGLEYKIVICPFSWQRSDLQKNAAPVFHPPGKNELTIDFTHPPDEGHTSLAKNELLGDKLRLLYVALTRARHQCHFVWGRFQGNEISAAAWLLHPAKGQAVADFEEHVKNLTPAQMRADLQQLAAAAPEAIAIADLPAEDATHYTPPQPSKGKLTARRFRGRIERDWKIASFTSWSAARESEAPDFDQLVAATPDAGALAGVHALPRGAKAGTFFHEIFEELDFQSPTAIEPLVARKLTAFGYGKEFLEAAVDCIRRSLAIPLRDASLLSAVPASARLNELEFCFPFSLTTSARLAEILAPAPAKIGRVQFDPQRGFLRGFIDLIFESSGRYHIVDWKSNWLGPDPSAYGPEALRAEMERHHYALQYHIYAIALHRYLAQRLPDYRYEEHFGGVHYLFLRGLDPAQPGHGVFHDRPARELIEALEALFSPASR